MCSGENYPQTYLDAAADLLGRGSRKFGDLLEHVENADDTADDTEEFARSVRGEITDARDELNELLQTADALVVQFGGSPMAPPAGGSAAVPLRLVLKNFTRLRETIPESVYDSMLAYLLRGEHFGHFIEAVLRNDLVDAVTRADLDNLRHIADIMRFVYNALPREAWGSKAAVDAWRDARGREPWKEAMAA